MMVNKTLLISDNGNNTEYDEHIEDDKEMIKVIITMRKIQVIIMILIKKKL